ncbi:hypothetical protein MCEL_24940 [Mycolicibacterium celeriflavum]|uniref:Uncharacterized protein n=1 Tax=Mycolicibacterium celeriflavum TaxID=1249101 RepID=A0A7I7RJX7_MYCCF|nr:hypothetical protein MCEL_24940 [Mycolicibacterium celeriflavum]
MAELIEDVDDLWHQVFVHDQLAAVNLAVHPKVVDLDAPQLCRVERATWAPTFTEFGGGDGQDSSGRW